MATITWGKPKIEVCKLSGSELPETPTWTTLPTPVAESTQLTTVKGDRLEAKIEGGGYDDIRYKKSTYNLVLNLRKTKGLEAPIANEDGVVDGMYAVRVTPEDPSLDGFLMNSCAVSVEDSWNATDGGIWVYTFELCGSQSSLRVWNAENGGGNNDSGNNDSGSNEGGNNDGGDDGGGDEGGWADPSA